MKNPLQARHEAVEFTPRQDTGGNAAVKYKCAVVKMNINNKNSSNQNIKNPVIIIIIKWILIYNNSIIINKH